MLKHIPGFICAFRFDDTGRPTALAETSDIAESLEGASFLWLHLNLADQRCQRYLINELQVQPIVASAFSAPATRQCFDSYQGVFHGHLSDFRREFDSDSTEHAWSHFICTSRLLITGRVKAVQSAERLRRELTAGVGCASSAELLMRTISNYPDTLDGVIYRLMNELELIEDQVLGEKHRSERQRLMLVRRETAQLHRHMRAQRRALQQAERSIPQMPEGVSAIITRLIHLDQDFEGLEARARFFHDEIDAKLASETNRQLYILSALTAAFLPPTLVAGLFGMNFPAIPFAGGAGGFWWAIGICVLSSAAVWLFLWRANSN